MTGSTRLALVGVGCVGSAYGMARYGFGLLLPEMRAALRLSPPAIAAIASGGYGAFLLASLGVGALVARRGPRAVVMAGGGFGVAGMLLAGIASSPLSLGIAVAIAATSAALVFPPFADAVASVVPPANRGRVLATVSSGTGAGVAAAAPLALLAGWRLTWVLFAAVALAVTVLAARSVPATPLGSAAGPKRRTGRPPGAWPLLVAALFVGLGAAVFWTWGVDRVATEGGLGAGAAQALYVAVGIASLGGALSGDLVARVGLGVGAALCGALLASAMIALAVAPGVLGVAIAAAVLFGAAYNGLVALQGLWSSQLYAQQPARGLAAVMTAMGIGFLFGPPLASLLPQETAFLAAAGAVAAAGAAPISLHELHRRYAGGAQRAAMSGATKVTASASRRPGASCSSRTSTPPRSA